MDQAKQTDELREYLEPTSFIDSDHPEIQAWAHEVTKDATSDVEKAVKLYYAVRDGIFYNPYRVKITRDDLKASATLERGRAFCIPKAILMAAGARAVGIPCRLGFADVRNHLTSENLRAALRSDVFSFHGYVEIWLNGRWVKATPTFNIELCERAQVSPLEFDGTEDALFHEYNLEGDRSMEYIHHHGTFADFPHKQMLRVWKQAYPHLFDGDQPLPLDGDLARELQEEALRGEAA